MKHIHQVITVLAIACTHAHGSTDRRDMPLKNCPAPVQATINANARGGVVEEVDAISIDGREIYIADVDLPGDLDLKIYVAGDGALVKIREDVPLADTPISITQAVAKLGGTIDEVDKETRDKTVTWHLEIDRKEAPDLDVVVSAEGSIVSKTEDKDS
jgi:hypothetical protein